MRALKTYGWTAMVYTPTIRKQLGMAHDNHHNQVRAICATTSQAELCRIVGTKRPSQLWNLGITGNKYEIAKAESKPGHVFIQPLDAYGPAAVSIQIDPKKVHII